LGGGLNDLESSPLWSYAPLYEDTRKRPNPSRIPRQPNKLKLCERLARATEKDEPVRRKEQSGGDVRQGMLVHLTVAGGRGLATMGATWAVSLCFSGPTSDMESQRGIVFEGQKARVRSSSTRSGRGLSPLSIERGLQSMHRHDVHATPPSACATQTGRPVATP
jgi:hypothetical protein